MHSLTSNPSLKIAKNANVLFSVIMASYNRKYCIDKAIQSALSQNYDNFELLIVDDGSTDGTVDHLKETYTKEIVRGKINLIPINKSGVSIARNIGLNNAKYDWICYLDTDNQMLPFYFETFNQYIRANPEYQCFYAKIRLRTSGNVIGKPFSFFDLLQANFIDMGTFVHSKALCQKLGNHDINLTSLVDWDLAIRYTALYKPYFIDTIVLDYNDVTSDRITDKANNVDVYKQLMTKKIFINLEFLANNLYPPESLRWAVNHLLKIFFKKIKILPTRNIFRQNHL